MLDMVNQDENLDRLSVVVGLWLFCGLMRLGESFVLVFILSFLRLASLMETAVCLVAKRMNPLSFIFVFLSSQCHSGQRFLLF